MPNEGKRPIVSITDARARLKQSEIVIDAPNGVTISFGSLRFHISPSVIHGETIEITKTGDDSLDGLLITPIHTNKISIK